MSNTLFIGMTRAPELFGIPRQYIMWGMVLSFAPFIITKSMPLLFVMALLTYGIIRLLVWLDPHVISILDKKLAIGFTANRSLYGGNNYGV